DRAQAAYEGGPMSRGEVEEACLARSYPDYEALAAGGRFAALAPRLYQALLAWSAGAVQVVPHAQQEIAGE
ncbi:hypothetical protein, partial [Pelomonas sp. KK5]|uniref:hypothetical protein n=1 Tax=Pelomonas sp. KK5 TaxID=1855730 RepID=UPI001301B2CC